MSAFGRALICCTYSPSLEAVKFGAKSRAHRTCAKSGLALAEYEGDASTICPYAVDRLPIRMGCGSAGPGQRFSIAKIPSSRSSRHPPEYALVQTNLSRLVSSFARDGGMVAPEAMHPWRTRLEVLRCPSDPGRSRLAVGAAWGDPTQGFVWAIHKWNRVDVRTQVNKLVRMFQQRHQHASRGLYRWTGQHHASFGEIATPMSHLNGKRTAGAADSRISGNAYAATDRGAWYHPRDCLAKATRGNTSGPVVT